MENPYLTSARVWAALRALELRPTRGMGQNFLVDSDALSAIVTAAELTPDDTVLEVGPGLGVLTWELLRAAGHVVAVELDLRLVDRLRQEFRDEPRLTVVQGDILKLPPGDLIGDKRPTTNDQRPSDIHDSGSSYQDDQRSMTNDEGLTDIHDSRWSFVVGRSSYKVVANLPYAITSPALRHFLETAHKPTLMVVLVQWEVAQRIVARPGDLSVLAHSIQIYAEPEIVARVRAASFVPAPAVDSAVLRLRVRPRPAVDVDVDALLRVVKAGFLQARKQLANALPAGLASIGRPIEKEQAVAALHAAGVDPSRRAETLTLEEWVRLYEQLRVLS